MSAWVERKTSPSPPPAAIMVAHPDDETLWAGGFVLEHAEWDWFIGTLCRASDPDRAPKFARVLERLHARGGMLDMEDAPEQRPLPTLDVQRQVLMLLPGIHFDMLLAHGPQGEYTWHRRHVEVCQAVVALWRAGRTSTDALWLFAYEDGERQYLPRAVRDAHLRLPLPPEVEVKGQGVVGAQPKIKPGESFEYTSGSVLATPVGTMRGSYQMVAEDGTLFDATIPEFTLSAPRVLH